MTIDHILDLLNLTAFEVWRNRIRTPDQSGDEFGLYRTRSWHYSSRVKPYIVVGHLKVAIP
jgi:hypothetical protein